MSKEKSCSFKTSVGGSAVIEGVMMLGPKKMAVTVRKPDGEIVTEEMATSSVREKSMPPPHSPAVRSLCC